MTRKCKEIVLATRNKYKIKEIKQILKGLNLKIYSLNDFRNIPEIKEDGKSFKENAVKKAKFVAEKTNKISLADDSGIEVDVLNNAPGIYSARFASNNATDKENNKKLLKLLNKVPFDKRKAQYKCVMVLATPSGKTITTTGTCSGIITFGEKGKYGFGYDPLFFVPEYNCTMAELPPSIKNKISHRSKAVEKMKKFLKEL